MILEYWLTYIQSHLYGGLVVNVRCLGVATVHVPESLTTV